MKYRPSFFLRNKYETLLVSLLLLLFGQLLIPSKLEWNAQPIFMIQFILAGVVLFWDNPKLRKILINLSVVIIALELFEIFSDWKKINTVIDGLYILYFLSLSMKVYTHIFKSKNVTSEIIAAVVCGFIMLGVISGMLFLVVEMNHPGSFSNLSKGLNTYQDLQYFGFITSLTIGYGDIVPLSLIAKKMTMLMGLLGNFYSILVVGIIIGKFLNNKD